MTKLDKYSFQIDAYSRNIGILTKSEQYLLSNKKVAIPGMGGVGGHHLINMIRIGVGKFNIADFDVFEAANTNRQYGAKKSNYGKHKAEVMKNEALDINPHCEINIFKNGINEQNIDDFLDNVDLVVDGLDFFNFKIRRLLFNKAYEKGIYVITAGPIGLSSAMLVFSPTNKMTFDKYFDVNDQSHEPEVYLNFLLGLTPKATHRSYGDNRYIKLQEKIGPSITIGCTLATSTACTESIRILLSRPQIRPVPYFIQYDLYTRKFKNGVLRWGLKGPIMKIMKQIGKVQLTNIENYLQSPELAIPWDENNTNTISNTSLKYIVSAGILAPSGDNCQPWQFKIEDNSISIFLDSSADQSDYNFNQLASSLSCGAVIYNMKIAASALHLKTDIQYLNKDEKIINISHKIARLNFAYDKSIQTNVHLTVINDRHTNRTKFKKMDIDNNIIETINSTEQNGIDVKFIKSKNEIRKISNIAYSLERLRCKRKNMHMHLINHTMFDIKSAKDKKYGFHTKNLNLNWLESKILKILSSWTIAKILFSIFRIDLIFANVAKKNVLNSSGLILIKGEDSTPKSYIKAGETMEKIWLESTLQGLDIQPIGMASIFLSIYKLKPSLLNPKELKILKKNTILLSSILNLKQNEIPYILLKIGKGSIPKQGTLRKDLDKFTA